MFFILVYVRKICLVLALLFLSEIRPDKYYSNVHKLSFIHFCDETQPHCLHFCDCQNVDYCISKPIDPRLQEFITVRLNEMRQDRASKATLKPAGMTMLSYDKQLEEISNCHIGQCISEPTDCFLTETFSDVSQATAVLNASQLNPEIFKNGGKDKITPYEKLWQQIITLYWSKDVSSLADDSIKKYNNQTNKNGAAIMHDYAVAIGCAFAMFNKASKFAIYFTCSFGPSIKYGQPIYRVGSVCSGCQAGFICVDSQPFPTLCKQLSYEKHELVKANENVARSIPNRLGKRRKNSNANVYCVKISHLMTIICANFIMGIVFIN